MIDSYDDVCKRCGMEREEWGEQAGYQLKGDIYCCAGCAGETGCTCEGGVEQPSQTGGFAGL